MIMNELAVFLLRTKAIDDLPLFTFNCFDCFDCSFNFAYSNKVRGEAKKCRAYNADGYSLRRMLWDIGNNDSLQ